ncbi:hypothetical protein KY363_04015 [Candidatus Woesearchaeota archaeon]|nr:hypothetical protein [Candidatus Woesearchaeota archaeon]
MAGLKLKGEHSVLVLLEDTKLTSPEMVSVIKELLQARKLCYITISKTYDFVDKVLTEKQIDTSKVHYIDCISYSFKHTKANSKAEFVSSPGELTEMSAAIKKAIEKGYTAFVFDSLSSVSHTLAAGNDVLGRFYESFSDELKGANGVILFACSVEDEEKLLIQEAMPVFEKITHLGQPGLAKKKEEDMGPL